MELRVLQYFLAVAREQNISAAAPSPPSPASCGIWKKSWANS